MAQTVAEEYSGAAREGWGTGDSTPLQLNIHKLVSFNSASCPAQSLYFPLECVEEMLVVPAVSILSWSGITERNLVPCSPL
jgi:hypothetical protein